MDWPLVALISYGFVLLLLLVLIILRSRKNTHARYAKLLEEKEEKLQRMMLDVEENMQALDVYAEQLKDEWRALAKEDSAHYTQLERRVSELEAALIRLRARHGAIAEAVKTPPPPIAPPAQLPLPQVPAVQVPVTQAPVVQMPAINSDTPEEGSIRLQAKKLLESGATHKEVAKKLNLSRTELLLLEKQ